MKTLFTLVDRSTPPVLTVCALVMTGLVVRRELVPRVPAAKAQEATVDLRGRPIEGKISLDRRSLLGDSTATVTIVEFADFQCPYCARSAEMLHDIMRKNPKTVAVDFRHYPLQAHPHARDAAVASECAREQGKFSEFYFEAFANQSEIGKWKWSDFAKRAGVPDVRKFGDCVQTQRLGERIDGDLNLVTSLRISGTPAWVVNDSVFVGAPSAAQLQRWLTRPIGSANDVAKTASGDTTRDALGKR